MSEIEEWFERMFGYKGFTMGPLIIDPYNFTPRRCVMYGSIKTRINITPNLADDLHNSWSNVDPSQIYRDIIGEEINRFLGLQPKFGNRYIKKHKLI
jgi:hypothetical protein